MHTCKYLYHFTNRVFTPRDSYQYGSFPTHLYGNFRAIWPRQRTNRLASMLISRAIWFKKDEPRTLPVIGVNYRGAEVTGTMPRFLGVDALDKVT